MIRTYHNHNFFIEIDFTMSLILLEYIEPLSACLIKSVCKIFDVKVIKGIDSKLVPPFDKGGAFYLEFMGKAIPKAIQKINRPKKRDENSDNLIRRFQTHFWLLCIPKTQLG